MNLLLTLFFAMWPLYILVLLGVVAKRFLAVESKSIASLVVYILAPIITFHAVATTPLTVGALSLPVVMLAIALISSALFFAVGAWAFGKGSSRQYLLAATAGSSNAGYFGLGLALVLFPKDQVNLVILSILGSIVFLHTFGFYLTARGKFTAKESFHRLLRLPVIYAFLLGLLVHAVPVSFGPHYLEVMSWFRGSYTVLGMMIVGLSVATIGGEVFDKRFTALSLVAKFLLWPLLALGVLCVNRYYVHWYNAQAQEVIWLLSIVPIATNTVTYANLLEIHSDVSAVSVLVSTMLALAYIPLMWPVVHLFATR